MGTKPAPGALPILAPTESLGQLPVVSIHQEVKSFSEP